MNDHTPAHDVDAERYEAAAAAYEASPEFVTDAMEWLSTTASPPAAIVEATCDEYRQTRRFVDVVEDGLDGELRWTA